MLEKKDQASIVNRKVEKSLRSLGKRYLRSKLAFGPRAGEDGASWCAKGIGDVSGQASRPVNSLGVVCRGKIEGTSRRSERAASCLSAKNRKQGGVGGLQAGLQSGKVPTSRSGRSKRLTRYWRSCYAFTFAVKKSNREG